MCHHILWYYNKDKDKDTFRYRKIIDIFFLVLKIVLGTLAGLCESNT